MRTSAPQVRVPADSLPLAPPYPTNPFSLVRALSPPSSVEWSSGQELLIALVVLHDAEVDSAALAELHVQMDGLHASLDAERTKTAALVGEHRPSLLLTCREGACLPASAQPLTTSFAPSLGIGAVGGV